MSDFSITGAACAGFRVVRQHPQAAVIWAVGVLLLMAPLQVLLNPMVVAFSKLPPEAWQDSQRLNAALQPFASTWYGVSLCMLPARAVFLAAMNRAVLTPSADRFGYLRLGLDELRQLGVVLILTAISLLVSILGAALAGLSGNAGGAALAQLVTLVVLAIVNVRFSLASALTFDTGRTDLIAAWRLTRGRAVPILGAFALAWALSLIVLLLGGAVMVSVIAIAELVLSGLTHVTSPATDDVASLLDPVRLLWILLSAPLFALLLPVWLTPSAEVYRALTHATDRA